MLGYLAAVCLVVMVALLALNGWFNGERLSKRLSDATKLEIDVQAPGMWMGWPPGLKTNTLELRVRKHDSNPVIRAEDVRLAPDWSELLRAKISPAHAHIGALRIEHRGRQGNPEQDLVPPLRIPRQWLASLSNDVSLRVDKLHLGDLVLRKVELILTSSEAAIQRVDTEDGTLRLVLVYRVLDNAVELRATGKVGGYELGEDLKYTGVESEGSGSLAAEFNIHGAGADIAAIVASIGGDATLVLEDSKVRGDWLNSLVINLGDLIAPWSGAEQDVYVRCMYAAVSADNGHVHSDTAFFDTGKQLVSLRGDFRLPGGTLDLLLVPDAGLSNLMSMRVPVRIGGRVPHLEASAAPVEFIEQGFKQVLVAGVITGQAFLRLVSGNNVSAESGCGALAKEQGERVDGAQ